MTGLFLKSPVDLGSCDFVKENAVMAQYSEVDTAADGRRRCMERLTLEEDSTRKSS